jgi:terminase small subunit / prophage DNA-packing protein
MAEIVNKQRLSKILGKSERTLTEWQKEGMPIKKAGERGQSNTYDTEKVIDWLLKRASDSEGEMEKAKLRLIMAQAEMEELKVKEKKEELISLEKMKYLWANVLGSFRSRVLSIPTRLTPQIMIHKDPKKIERLIKDALYEALNELAEYDPESNSERKGRRKGGAKDSSTATTA